MSLAVVDESVVHPASTVRSYLRGLFEVQTVGLPRLLPLEGMRGISALLVFFVHFHSQFGNRAESPGLAHTFLFLQLMGHVGVDIFFALSGFIMYGMLMEKPVKYFSFIWRRVTRLYPVFATIFVLYVILDLTLAPNDRLAGPLGPKVLYLVENFLMLPGFFSIVPLITVAWSLSYELVFYLTLPLIISALRLSTWLHHKRIILVTVISIVHLALADLRVVGHPRMVMFTCGILLRETTSLPSIWSNQPSWRRLGSIASLVAFAGVFAIQGLPDPYSGFVSKMQGFRLDLVFVATYALGYFALGTDGFLNKWFRWDWIRWFGNISYSYYMVHGLVLHVLLKASNLIRVPQSLSIPSYLLLLLFSFVATLLAGALLFLVIEKPCWALRKIQSRSTSSS